MIVPPSVHALHRIVSALALAACATGVAGAQDDPAADTTPVEVQIGVDTSGESPRQCPHPLAGR